MSERFLRKADIAAMLGTSPNVAASILANQGVYPIDLGYGRGRGIRWLESAVIEAMKAMHSSSQPQIIKEKKNYHARKNQSIGLARMSIQDIQAILTPGQPVQ